MSTAGESALPVEPTPQGDAADVVEQTIPLVDEGTDGAGFEEGAEGLVEADPADRLEQMREVPADEDYDR